MAKREAGKEEEGNVSVMILTIGKGVRKAGSCLAGEQHKRTGHPNTRRKKGRSRSGLRMTHLFRQVMELRDRDCRLTQELEFALQVGDQEASPWIRDDDSDGRGCRNDGRRRR